MAGKGKEKFAKVARATRKRKAVAVTSPRLQSGHVRQRRLLCYLLFLQLLPLVLPLSLPILSPSLQLGSLLPRLQLCNPAGF